jgi:hypothetical protein
MYPRISALSNCKSLVDVGRCLSWVLIALLAHFLLAPAGTHIGNPFTDQRTESPVTKNNATKKPTVHPSSFITSPVLPVFPPEATSLPQERYSSANQPSCVVAVVTGPAHFLLDFESTRLSDLVDRAGVGRDWIGARFSDVRADSNSSIGFALSSGGVGGKEKYPCSASSSSEPWPVDPFHQYLLPSRLELSTLVRIVDSRDSPVDGSSSSKPFSLSTSESLLFSRFVLGLGRTHRVNLNRDASLASYIELSRPAERDFAPTAEEGV